MTDIRAAEDCGSGSSAMAVVRAGSGGRTDTASRRHLDSCGGKALLTRARGNGNLVRNFFIHRSSAGKYFT